MMTLFCIIIKRRHETVRDYFYNLGCVYLAKDMPEEAVENLEKASQLDVNKANQKIQVMLNIARGQAIKRKGR